MTAPGAVRKGASRPKTQDPKRDTGYRYDSARIIRSVGGQIRIGNNYRYGCARSSHTIRARRPAHNSKSITETVAPDCFAAREVGKKIRTEIQIRSHPKHPNQMWAGPSFEHNCRCDQPVASPSLSISFSPTLHDLSLAPSGSRPQGPHLLQAKYPPNRLSPAWAHPVVRTRSPKP